MTFRAFATTLMVTFAGACSSGNPATELPPQNGDTASDAGIHATDAAAPANGHDGGTTTMADMSTSGDAGSDNSKGDGGTNAGLTTLRVHYPAGAHAVTVRGDSGTLSWTSGTAMTSAGTNTYEYAVTLPATSTEVTWKPLLDDATWSLGANYIAKRGTTVDAYPRFFTQNGTVSQLFAPFHSNLLNNDRTVWVYLPASYSENTEASYPVLYMQDGESLFDVQPNLGTNGWRVDNALNVAAQDGSIREFIVVAPESLPDPVRTYEYTPTYVASEGQSGGGDIYLNFLVQELKPQVDQMLRTQTSAAATGMLGSSFGALISAYGGTTHADTFGIIGALSPSVWWDNDVLLKEVAATGSVRPTMVYSDCGTVDDGEAEAQELWAAYLALGYKNNVTFESVVQTGGQHSETYWAQRFPGAAAFLFGPRVP